MINLLTQYPGKVDPADPDYPYGTPRNITAPGDGLGTPWEKAWVKDLEGFKTALVGLAGIIPSSNPDTAVLSQMVEALQKVAPMLNVKAFGAVGDGVADDTIPVQAALDNSLGTNAIYFPPGDYNCGTLTVPSDTVLHGLGGELTLRTGTDGPLLTCAVGSERIVLQGLKLNGNSANNVGTAITDGLITIGSSGASPSSLIFIDRCTVLDSYSNGIVLHDDANVIKITECIIDGVDQDAGVVVSPTSGTTADIHVAACTILDCVGPGIVANGVINSGEFVDNHIDGTSGGAGAPMIRLREGANTDLTVANNTVLNSQYRGIALGGSRHVISGNNIQNFAQDGIRLEALLTDSSPDCVISNNTIIGAAAAIHGITVDDAPNVVITGNVVRTVQQNAIQLSNDNAIDTADGFVVVGNNLSGFDVYGVLVNGGLGMKNGSITGNVIDGVGVGTSISGIRIADGLEIACTGNRIDNCATGIDEVTAGIGDWNLYVGNIVRGCTAGISTPGPSNSIEASNLS